MTHVFHVLHALWLSSAGACARVPYRIECLIGFRLVENCAFLLLWLSRAAGVSATGEGGRHSAASSALSEFGLEDSERPKRKVLSHAITSKILCRCILCFE